jgi:multiple sugar transport system substrate-binding protein
VIKKPVHKKQQFLARGAARELLFFLILSLLLAACDGFLPGLQATPTLTPQVTTGSTPLAQTPALPQGSASATPPAPTASGPQPLVVWLPPQFDPSASSPAAVMLRARLDAFQAANPGVKLEIRVKAVSGPGGLINSLSTTSAAAPANLPGLVALSRPDLESAALKGLVFPLDDLSKLVDVPDWYTYAHQLAYIQGSPYGLPFAGDAQLLMFRAAQVPTPPADWPSLFKYNLPLAFAAADPQATLTLLLYLSAGGTVKDSQGRPALQADILARVLKLYSDGNKLGTFPSGLTQYQTDGQAAQAYHDQPPRAQWLVSWASRFLSELPADTSAMALPSLGNQPFTLATGWVWALSEPELQRRSVAVKLAEFLVDSDFLSQWTSAAGYLPTRPSALVGWSNQSLKTILSPVLLAAQVRPPNDLQFSLGPVLQDATLQIFNQQADPALVAQAAAERLAVPPAK